MTPLNHDHIQSRLSYITLIWIWLKIVITLCVKYKDNDQSRETTLFLSELILVIIVFREIQG